MMKIVLYLLLLFFYGLFIDQSFDEHKNTELTDYHNEVSGDKGGYMVYLPAAFCYKFEARQFPKGIDTTLGQGFKLNLATNTVETKYPYGTALLQAPFWGVAQWLSPDKNGFSLAVRKAIDVAGVTYFVLGLMLLFATLRRHFSVLAVLLALALLVWGTNLWYYAIIETGMSHVYSFFAFALLLWLVSRGSTSGADQPPRSRCEVLGIAAALALISVLRPINIVLALPLLLWPANPAAGWSQQLRKIGNWRNAVALAVAMLVFWLPQLLYYKYARGSYFVYSYGQEGFPYVFSPRLAEVWFAPNNGALLYNPLLVLVLVPGIWLLRRRSGWWGGLAALTWLAASYLYAAWWAYALGCGYGGRGFVELYPVLAWPLAALAENILVRRRVLVAALCVALAWYNMRLSDNLDRCFYAKSDWDWQSYQVLLNQEPK
jgi:hypothetical protein